MRCRGVRRRDRNPGHPEAALRRASQPRTATQISGPRNGAIRIAANPHVGPSRTAIQISLATRRAIQIAVNRPAPPSGTATRTSVRSRGTQIAAQASPWALAMETRLQIARSTAPLRRGRTSALTTHASPADDEIPQKRTFRRALGWRSLLRLEPANSFPSASALLKGSATAQLQAIGRPTECDDHAAKSLNDSGRYNSRHLGILIPTARVSGKASVSPQIAKLESTTRQ